MTRVMSGTYVPFSRSLGLGSREGAAGVVGCGMQVSQSTYSIHLQQEMQPCQMLAAFLKEASKSEYVHEVAGSQTAPFFSFSPAVIIFLSLLITSIRGRAFICSRLFYSLLARGLETSTGQRG